VLKQVTDARILAGGIDKEFLDRLRIVAQLGSHGMKTVNQAGGHGSFLNIGRRILPRQARLPETGSMPLELNRQTSRQF
jgi:hypothetical protein